MKHEPLRAVLDAITLDPAGDHTLLAMAERAHFSVRHLSRLFDEHVGMSAASYVERARVEAARAMLEGGDDGLELVAKRTGFGSVETMRRAFLRGLGVTPGVYRSQFRTTGIGSNREAAHDDLWPDAFHRVPVSPPA